MRVLAGTEKGVFVVERTSSRHILESEAVIELVKIDERLLAGTESGIYVSDDDGQNWQYVGLGKFEIWQIRTATNGWIYATTSPSGLFRSKDGGDTWDVVVGFTKAPGFEDWCVPISPPLPGRARALLIDQRDADRIMVGIEVGGIAITKDAGETWDLILPGENPDLHMLFSNPENPDIIYASAGYGRLVGGSADKVEGNAGVFRSDDAGQNWKYVWRGIRPMYARPMCIDTRAPYPLTVSSAPGSMSSFRDEGGAQAMIYRSDDQGESWHSLCDTAHSPSDANFHGLNIDPGNKGGILTGTDTGEVWQISANGSWTLLGEDMPHVWSVIAY